METNSLTVTDDPADLALQNSKFNIGQAHWIYGQPKVGDYQVRTRYRAPLIQCTVAQTNQAYSINMDHPDRAVTPGQSAVIYDGTKVIGGGIITSNSPSPKKPLSKVQL